MKQRDRLGSWPPVFGGWRLAVSLVVSPLVAGGSVPGGRECEVGDGDGPVVVGRFVAPDLSVEEVAGMVSESGVRGVSLWWRSGWEGLGLCYAYGLPADNGGVAVESTSRFRVGSVSKLVTALAALRAVEGGWLSLETTVAEYFPDLLVGSGADGVTLGHLLEHTSGLAGSTYAEYAFSEGAVGPRDYLERWAPLRLRWSPGLHYSYANPGYALAGGLLEVATGVDFDAWVRREVFEPLGMLDSHFGGREDSLDGVLPSFLANGDLSGVWLMGVRPAGSLVTTAPDLGRLVETLVNGGVVPGGGRWLSVEMLGRWARGEQSLAGRAGLGDGVYALGNFPFVAGGSLYRGHWGRTDGFQATVGFDPESGAAMVILSNHADRRPMQELRDRLGRRLAGVVSGEGEVAGAVLAEGAAAGLPAVGGIFVNFSHDMPHRAWLFSLLEAKVLRVMPWGLEVRSAVMPGAAVRWLRVGADIFRAEDLPVATGALVELDGGWWWVDGESYRAVPRAFWVLQWLGLVVGLVAALVASGWALGAMVARLFGHFGTFFGKPAVVGRGAGFGAGVVFWLGLGGASLLLMLMWYLRSGLFSGLVGAAALGTANPYSLALLGLSLAFPVGILGAGWQLFGRRARRMGGGSGGGRGGWVRGAQWVLWWALVGSLGQWVAFGMVPLVTWW